MRGRSPTHAISWANTLIESLKNTSEVGRNVLQECPQPRSGERGSDRGQHGPVIVERSVTVEVTGSVTT
jgi:hypothetical protein